MANDADRESVPESHSGSRTAGWRSERRSGDVRRIRSGVAFRVRDDAYSHRARVARPHARRRMACPVARPRQSRTMRGGEIPCGRKGIAREVILMASELECVLT